MVAVVLSGLTALFFSASSLAVMSLPDGWYLDGNVGSTHLSNKSYPGSASSSGIGGSADMGYKFMPFFGLELGYSRYANTSIKDPSTDTKAGWDKHYSYDLAGKGILPFGQTGAEAIAKLGVGRNASSLSLTNTTAASNIGLGASQHSETNLYMAAGLQYNFVPELGVVVQWARQLGSSSTGNLDLLTAGFSFIFG